MRLPLSATFATQLMKNASYLCLFITLLFHLPSVAVGVTPYIPLNISDQLENDLEKLAVITNIPQLTKPYNVATVLRHLKMIKTSHPSLHRRLEKAMEPYSSKAAISAGKLSLSYYDTDEPFQLSNQMGSSSEQKYRLKLHGHWQSNPWFGVYAGIDTSNERTIPSGSVIAFGTDWAQVDLGYKERWWSPFHGSAQTISSHAQTLPSIGLSNSHPISILNIPMAYEVFLAHTSRQDVNYNNEWSDKNRPYFSGIHFSFQPYTWWTLGLNRMFMFGGGDRKTGIEDVFRAIIDPRGADNTTSELSRDEETGNQIASLISRINYKHFSIFMEYAGEDTSNNKAWQLGNSALNGGIFIHSIGNTRLSLTYEYSDWQDGWYSHHLYDQGLSHHGFILGHDAHILSADPNLDLSGNSQLIKVNFALDRTGHTSFSAKQTKFDTQSNESTILRINQEFTFGTFTPNISLYLIESEESRFFGGQLSITFH